MTQRTTLIAVFALLLAALPALAQQDADEAAPYFQSPAFNVPALAGWADQSNGDAAQYHFAAARATIRTALAPAADATAAATAELERLVGMPIGEPVFSDKANLADGTWTNLIYDIDETATASIMARRAGDRFVVISFVEQDPAARALMLTIPQADDTAETARAEMSAALASFAGVDLHDDAALQAIDLPSGSWRAYSDEGVQALGLVFGNDSYIALQTGDLGDLAALADAWNRTLLGFFITPDNSAYLALGLAAAFAILALLLLSFAWRARGIRQDIALLRELERDDP